MTRQRELDGAVLDGRRKPLMLPGITSAEPLIAHQPTRGRSRPDRRADRGRGGAPRFSGAAADVGVCLRALNLGPEFFLYSARSVSA